MERHGPIAREAVELVCAGLQTNEHFWLNEIFNADEFWSTFDFTILGIYLKTMLYFIPI